MILQLAYHQILEDTKIESEVGYRVRLWLVVLADSCVSRADRRLLDNLRDTFPEVSFSQIQPVSQQFTQTDLSLIFYL
jgi:hypothetical protein